MTGTQRGNQRPDSEDALVREATSWIRAKVEETVKLGAMEVGDYVLARFFGNDPQLVKSKDPNKSASFRALAARCGTAELPVSKTWLNNAVGIALMTRLLPDSAQAFRALPPSFQESLLPISDPAKVEKLARQAAARGLTFRKLRQLVAEERARVGGSPERSVSMSPLLRMLERVVHLLEHHPGEPSLAAAEVANLDKEVREDVARRLDLVVQKLQELAGDLRRGP